MSSPVRSPISEPREAGPPVAPPPRLRDEFRAKLRERVLETAAAMVIERGWDRLRMTHLATRCGVSRSTIFHEFGDKNGLARAVVRHEANRVVAQVSAVLSQSQEWSVGVLGVIETTLRARDHSPLIGAVLEARHSDTALLPHLTTGSAPLIARVRALLSGFLREHHPRLSEAACDDVVDTLVRETLSHLVAPELDHDATILRLHRLARRLLTPASHSPS